MRVFVLLFNAQTENEGIHTVQIGDRNKVLMFQDEDDATRYSLMLEAQDFPTPTVEAFESEEIEEFCQGANYDWEIVEAGKLAIPPEKNLDTTDWELEGKQVEQKSQSQSELETETETEISNSELDRIRRQLEGLL